MRTITSTLSFLLLYLTRWIFTVIVLTPGFAYALKDLPKGFSMPVQGFIENKGQIIDQNHKPNPGVLYLFNSQGMNVQLRPEGFSYDIFQIAGVNNDPALTEGPSSYVATYHRIDFDLIGYNQEYQIVPVNESLDYDNYYDAYSSLAGIKGVRRFQGVTYQNIYNGIDLEFMVNQENKFEYNFIIHPGANVSDIRIKMSEAPEYLSTRDSIRFSTLCGEIVEQIPESYFIQNDLRTSVPVEFQKSPENLLGFTCKKKIPSDALLVIDPTSTRVWGTYYGGALGDKGNSIASDGKGNIFMVGETASYENIATSGAFIETKVVTYLVSFLVKFNANGIRQWGTYYYGDYNGDITMTSCRTDSKGNVYIGGYSDADSGIATPGSYQPFCAGEWDGVLAKFTTNGDRVWATYYGGEDNDRITEVIGNGIAIDLMGNIYIVGWTGSQTNISTPGSYQPVKDSTDDGFIVKFDSTCTRIWGTYYGGESDEWFTACAVNSAGYLLAYGRTESDSGIASPGAHQTTRGGNDDTYVTLFTPDGQRLWCTYYGGTQQELGESCFLDDQGNAYITGWTQSPEGIASPGSYQSTLKGTHDAFLAKFTFSGTRLWGTYFGGPQMEHAKGLSVSENGDIFISGTTNSTSGVATANAFMETYQGGTSDSFLAKFDATGGLKWGTYFGNTMNEESNDLVYVSSDTIYFDGFTRSLSNIATPGAHQTSMAGVWDSYLEKFIDCWPIAAAGPMTGPNNVCQSSTGLFYSIPSIAHAVDYVWKVPSGATITAGAGTTGIFVDFSGSALSGYISVKGLNKCGDAGDSAYIYVTVHPRPNITITGDFNPCTGPSYLYSTEPGNTVYQWNVTPGGTVIAGGSSNDNTITIIWTVGGLQGISVNYTDPNGCNGGTPTTTMFFVNPGPPVDVVISASATTICQGELVTFMATPTNPGLSPVYQWKVNGLNVGTNSTVFTYPPANNDVVICVMTADLTCSMNNPDTSNAVTITVNPDNPVSVSIAASQNPVCEGTSVTFTATPMFGGTNPSYQWKVNGINAGTNNSVFTYIPVNNDIVTCILTSSETVCVTNNPATSNQVIMTVNPNLPVSVTISPSANPVCAGSSVTFAALPVNEGLSPVYQWKVNGTNVGSNSAVYTYTPVTGDLVSCILTSSETVCVTNNPATSNTINMVVNPNIPVSISIAASANPVCSGTPVTFTATPVNEGTTPSYQWKVNGINSGLDNPVFVYTPVNNDVILCVLTSSETVCVSNNPATSNAVTMTVNPVLPVSITIAASANPVCSATPVTFTATPVNGGTLPVYQWTVNGATVGTNSPIYTYNPASGDLVACMLTSNATCAIGNPATSNTITMTVASAPVVTFSACFDTMTTVNAKPIRLRGGIPLGGSYTGAGVSGGMFYPAIAGPGTHIITYTYTNAASCFSSDNLSLHVLSPSPFTCGSLLVDIRDSKSYPTVQLGGQCWMAANLNYGLQIAGVTDQRDNCVNEKYCYNDVPATCQQQGALYQWDEMMKFDATAAVQGLCPPAWHVPTEADWNTLFALYISNAFAGSPLKYSGYSGFNALMSGIRAFNKSWNYNGFATFFWSSTAWSSTKAWAHAMNDIDPSVAWYPSYRANAFSVRCVKD